MTAKKLFVFRRSSHDHATGDVIDILPAQRSGGNQVDIENGFYTIITVTDLTDKLAEELLTRVKRLRAPKADDPLYHALLPSGDGKAGCITVDEATLLNYVEVV